MKRLTNRLSATFAIALLASAALIAGGGNTAAPDVRPPRPANPPVVAQDKAIVGCCGGGATEPAASATDERTRTLVLAQEKKAVKDKDQPKDKRPGPIEEAIRAGKIPPFKAPKQTKEYVAKLEAFREEIVKQKPAVNCVAVSVTLGGHTTAGDPELLSYDPPVTNVGGAWFGTSTFVAPTNGLYYFAVDFVRDPFNSPNLSHEDVFIYLRKNGQGAVGYAWAGESQHFDRATGAYHVILHLNRGEFVETILFSDNGTPRHVSNVNFSGHRICAN